MRSRLTAAAVAALLAAPAPAAEPGSDIARIKADIFYLAGPECEGRGIETKGILKAGDYIAHTFKEAGLKPGGKDGSYFQPFVIYGAGKLGEPNTLTLSGPEDRKPELKYGRDFVTVGLSAKGKAAAGVVFAGYGITTADGEYDDYAGLDVKGKWVVVLRKTPRADVKGTAPNPTAPFAGLPDKADNAVQHGAAGIIFVNHKSDAGDDKLMDFGYMAAAHAEVPAVQVRRSVLEKMLAACGKKLADVEKAIDKDLKPRSFELAGWRAAAEVTVNRPELPTRNVVGVSEGSGPLADETVVVGAHYDHLGRGEPGSLLGAKGKGLVHYGADDNGSGTTGLLELARRFGARKDRVGRRIVFVAFSGEERGLFGSKYYVKHPAFPLEKTVFMLNMDMIGRVARVYDEAALARVGVPAGPAAAVASGAVPRRDRVVVYGTGTAEGLEKYVDDVNKRFDFKMLKLPGGTGPSDHDSFYRRKVPVLFLFTGTHRDYHRPTDTPDKINLPGLKKVADFAEVVLNHFATAGRPKYLVTRTGWTDPTDETPRVSRPQAPKLGIQPGNYESQDGGVLVEDLVPGGAAEKAGLQPQDVIVEIAGKPVKNIYGYMAVMSGLKPNVPVEVVVLRKDKKTTIKVTPLAP